MFVHNSHHLWVFSFVFKMLYVLLVKFQDEQYHNKIKQLNQRQLALIKASMDFVVAIGLLQLAPKKITPRVTGALGFVTSLISCYQVALTKSTITFQENLCKILIPRFLLALLCHSCFLHQQGRRKHECGGSL